MSTTNGGTFPLKPDDVIVAVAAAYQLNPSDLIAYRRPGRCPKRAWCSTSSSTTNATSAGVVSPTCSAG